MLWRGETSKIGEGVKQTKRPLNISLRVGRIVKWIYLLKTKPPMNSALLTSEGTPVKCNPVLDHGERPFRYGYRTKTLVGSPQGKVV